MTEREFLERRAERVKARLTRRTGMLHDELERAVGPLVREHPRASLAVGAAIGVALGAAAGRPAGPAARRHGGLFAVARRGAARLLSAGFLDALR